MGYNTSQECLSRSTDPAQGPPPPYDYQAEQLTNTTAVVEIQPKAAATCTPFSPPEKDYSKIAICAFLFSLCTLITCGVSLICLSLSIPALILSIVAMGTKGSAKKNSAGVSIGLNVAVVICSVLLVVVVTPVTHHLITTATASTVCTPYYSNYYRTTCEPNSYIIDFGRTCSFRCIP